MSQDVFCKSESEVTENRGISALKVINIKLNKNILILFLLLKSPYPKSQQLQPTIFRISISTISFQYFESHFSILAWK